MTAAVWFSIANAIALFAWALLIFFPKGELTRYLVNSGRTSFILCLGYWIALAAVGISYTSPMTWGIGSFSAVRVLFSSDWGLLAAWVHLLAFDLLIGADINRHFTERNTALRWLLLALTFVFGPVGWTLSKLLEKRPAFAET